jgi:hypothetical protein
VTKYISLPTTIAYGTFCISSCSTKVMGLNAFVNLTPKDMGIKIGLISTM